MGRSWTGARRPTWSPWPAGRRPAARGAGPCACGRAAGRARGGRRPRARDGAAHTGQTALKPWLRQQRGIPPAAHAAFGYPREDVLAIDTRPADPRRPLVCRDELSSRGSARAGRHARPRRAGRRADAEYVRNGAGNSFRLDEPLRGQRRASARSTRVDRALAVKALLELLDEQHPAAEGRVDGRFTTAAARIKLKHLYPSLQE